MVVTLVTMTGSTVSIVVTVTMMVIITVVVMVTVTAIALIHTVVMIIQSKRTVGVIVGDTEVTIMGPLAGMGVVQVWLIHSQC